MTPSLLSRRFTSIEPLEARIAPALLITGGNLLGGSGNPSTGETSVGENAATLIKVTSGQALVWFDGSDIRGISIGANTSLEIHGNVLGDIVANLGSNGLLTDSDNDPTNGEDGAILLAHNLTGLKTFPISGTTGDVRNIITGGSVSNVSVNGTLQGVFAGDGAFTALGTVVSSTLTPDKKTPFDFNPIAAGVQSTFTFAQENAVLQAGASVKGITIQTAKELQIYSGSGNPLGAVSGKAAAGGNIENITITSAFVESDGGANAASYTIVAGAGGSGSSGGAGGSISKVVEKSSNGLVVITAGAGGSGTTGPGGAGGSIRGLDLQSDSATYAVTAGAGGSGSSGGAGGGLFANNFSGQTPNTGIIVMADFTGDGNDDVLVVDSGTGSMVLSRNSGTGFEFSQVEQYRTEEADTPVFLIGGLGTTPVDAKAADFDGDGRLDIVVAYKNSSSLAVYYNKGGGVFWDAAKQALSGTALLLDFVPSKIAVGQFGGSAHLDIAVLETNATSSVLYVVQGLAADDKSPVSTLALQPGSTVLSSRAADFIAGPKDSGTLFIGMQNGRISSASATFTDATKPFVEVPNRASITGGVANLDLSPDGKQLLALSTNARSLGLFDIGTGSSLTAVAAPDLKITGGRALVAHYLPKDATGTNTIAVLSSLNTGARVDLFKARAAGEATLPDDPAFDLTNTISSTGTLKNFVTGKSAGTFGIAALGGSLSQFLFSQAANDFKQYGLPFSGKSVNATAGDGGLAIGTGKGGAGGDIQGFNAEATEVRLFAGKGGNSKTGAAGAGGSIANSANFTTSSGAAVSPRLVAESTLSLLGGNGGSAVEAGRSATGGAGGSITGLSLTLTTGDIEVLAGDGGNGSGGAGGAGGNVSALKTKALDGGLSITAGDGGNAGSGKVAGGRGGSIAGLDHAQELDETTDKLQRAYEITLRTGAGGNSVEGLGGAGGGFQRISMVIDAANSGDSETESTTRVIMAAANGGNGTSGGAGGGMSAITITAVHDETTEEKQIRTSFVTAALTAGAGGVGTAGNGGAGGSIAQAKLSGITSADVDAGVGDAFAAENAPLYVAAGGGGDGSVRGGAGGAVTALTAQNSRLTEDTVLTATMLRGATILSGSGGNGGSSDGGKGGDISGVVAGTRLGSLIVSAGSGGDCGAQAGALSGKGGNGGAVLKSTLGSTSSVMDLALGVFTGDGGTGRTAGGAGGLMSDLQLNTSQLNLGRSAVLVAGDGGAAAGSGALGGRGGDISKITQSKDINSTINLIEAGNGGASTAGRGGNGGNVTAVKTAGFIGKPADDGTRLGAFDLLNGVEFAQGIFAGRGGEGAVSDGVAGAVSKIVARQIAAISAAVDETGLFGVASKVSSVNATVIGYDVDQDGVFDSTGSGSPSQVKPIDGFVLAAIIELNNAPFRFTA